MRHEIKIEPPEFARILDGSKNFIVTDEAPGVQKADVVVLKEYDPRPLNSTGSEPRGFTGRPDLEFTIGFVETMGSRCILSLLPAPKPDLTRPAKPKGSRQ